MPPFSPLREEQMKLLDLNGKKFNLLTVVSFHHRSADGAPFYECVCDCGTTTITRVYNVKHGTTKSCGCLKLVPIPKGKASFNNLYSRYKKDARKRHLSFSLDEERFKDITSKPCFYCGSEPVPYRHHDKCFTVFKKWHRQGGQCSWVRGTQCGALLQDMQPG
jgi:hypothetical protein